MLRAQNYKHDLGGTVKDYFIVFAYQIAIICAWFFSEGRPETGNPANKTSQRI